MIETQIREDPDCGHKEKFKKQLRLKRAREIRKQLIQIDEKTLKPNIEKQEQVLRKLSEEANKAIVGEYKHRLANLESAIEGMQEDSRRTLQLQEIMAEDTILIKKMQKEAKAKKMQQYHEKQMEQMASVMTSLQKIDYNTSESKWKTRLSRKVGVWNGFD